MHAEMAIAVAIGVVLAERFVAGNNPLGNVKEGATPPLPRGQDFVHPKKVFVTRKQDNRLIGLQAVEVRQSRNTANVFCRKGVASPKGVELHLRVRDHTERPNKTLWPAQRCCWFLTHFFR